MECSHSKKICGLKRTEDGYIRQDRCSECQETFICGHFKIQKQATRYGRDRYKPAAVINAIEEFTIDAINEIADIGDY